ncbi:MAG TPA: hypothetical protein VNF07_11470 [Acidimicrobiales bacterium]|nr:hypothetical protein [Acidimicrobiales bacterium]
MAETDLLIPAYTSRARRDKQVGNVNTTEVPGLAKALARPPVRLPLHFVLTAGQTIDSEVLLPDAVGMLLLKSGARKVRDEDRDCTDLWRCLEVAAAENVQPSDLPDDPIVGDLGTFLRQHLGRGGRAMEAILRNLTPEAAAERETRIQALLLRVAGPA